MSDARLRTITFTLNGRPARATVASHETVVEVLQRDFGLFGARESCGQGLCGCCTVIVDGTAVSGCLYLAAFIDGTTLVTIEGLSDRGTLHPIQEAFWECHGLQCGFCTPGMILSAHQLLIRNPKPTENEIRHALDGNLCRCTGYQHIVDAVQYAAKRMRQKPKARRRS